jgi:glycosyltransferase involved in cell wall biosynthesis
VYQEIKIGIFSGKVPSTTFVENLIIGLSKNFIVHVYGRQYKNVNYQSRNIKLFTIPNSRISRVIFFLKMLLQSLFFSKKHLFNHLKKIKTFPFYRKILNLERVLPIINHPPDILHFQWVSSIQLLENYRGNFKTVLSLRGSQINMNPVFFKSTRNKNIKHFKNISGFHAVSDDIKKISRNCIEKHKKIKVIRPAINEINLKLSNRSWKYKNNEKLKIISVGVNRWKKGYTYSLDAIKLLVDKNIQFSYTIIAPGRDDENINYQIDNLKLSEYVNYISGMPHQQALKKIKNSHLLLLPSLSEGIANVVLESMSLGVPVLSTNCSGMGEVITNNVNGFLVPPRSPKKIALKINDIINLNNTSMSKIINAAKDTIVKNHLISNQVKDFKSLYYDILNE